MDQAHTFTRRADAALRRDPNVLGPTPGRLYRRLRQLDSHAVASRWVAEPVDAEQSNAAHAPVLPTGLMVLYQIVGPGTRAIPGQFEAITEHLRGLQHAHLLPIVDAWTDQRTGCFLVSPYAGIGEGLLTLDVLLRLKPDGRLAPVETRHMLAQMLAAMAHAHERGVSHGPVRYDEVIVDFKGSLKLELFGVKRSLEAPRPPTDAEIALEVRSVVELAFQAVTGSRPSDGLRPAVRRMSKPDRALSDWLERGLHPQAGFDTAIQALRALPKAGADWREPKGSSATESLGAKLESTPLGLLARLVS
ncbi:MAG: hypothetical protein AAGI30_14365 [Planctomycetota bacterium]